MTQLKDKTALITGGASGIGLGIAKALLQAGARVIVVDIREDHLAAARDCLEPKDRVLALRLDITQRDQYQQAVEQAQQQFGNIHLLVNNAGVAVVGPVEQATFSDWDWTLNVNLQGAINGIVILLPHILAHGEGGHIINTASMSGLLPGPGATIYATSKAALVGMSEAMRAELEPQGVMVSVFCPGPVQSNIAEAGKTRPQALADTGYAESDKRRQSIGSLAHLFKSAEEIGQRVRQGIENDELYILTHSEFAQGLRERAEAMLSAIPQVPESAELKNAFPMLMSNPAFAAEIKRQRGDNTA